MSGERAEKRGDFCYFWRRCVWYLGFLLPTPLLRRNGRLGPLMHFRAEYVEMDGTSANALLAVKIPDK